MNERRDWLVLSLKWSGGDFLVWYRSAVAGYTTDLMQAGRYSEAEAKSHEVRNVTKAVALETLGSEMRLFAVVLSDTEIGRRLLTSEEPNAEATA